MRGRGIARQLMLVLALGAPAAPAFAGGSSVAPLRDLPACALAHPAGEVKPPWAGVRLDPKANPARVGFAQLAMFRLEPSGETGRATVVRMSEGTGGRSISTGEWRTWVVRVSTARRLVVGISYSYRVPGKSDDVWIEKRGWRQKRGVSHEMLPAVVAADPLQRACDLLQRMAPGARVVFTERSRGWVGSPVVVRGFLSSGTDHPPSHHGIDIDRLTKGR